MSSRSSADRRRLELEIKNTGSIADVSCDHCFIFKKLCIMPREGEGGGSVRCSECVRRGKVCVGASWESLDRTRERTAEELNKSLEEMSSVMAKIERLRKTLKLAEHRADKKRLCLQEELFVEDQQSWRAEQSAVLRTDADQPLGPVNDRSLSWLDTFDWDASVLPDLSLGEFSIFLDSFVQRLTSLGDLNHPAKRPRLDDGVDLEISSSGPG